MSKTNTLFSYFNKKPNLNSSDQNGNTPKKDLPRKSCRNKNGIVSPNHEPEKLTSFSEGDLVWAKMEGYPWWPSLVFSHKGSHSRTHGLQTEIHVQFFDKPPSRGWVKQKFVKPFDGTDVKECKRGGVYFTSNVSCRKGADEAEKALKLTKDERLKLIVGHVSSDEEMEVDKFDDEIFDAEFDSGKENESTENESTEVAPGKRRPTRNLRSDPKRRKIVEPGDDDDDDEEEEEDDDSSADEFKPDKAEQSSDEQSEQEEEESESEGSGTEQTSRRKATPKVRKRKPPPAGTPRIQRTTSSPTTSPVAIPSVSTPSSDKPTPSRMTLSSKTKSKLAGFSAPEQASVSGPGDQGRSFPHQILDFLQPGKIKDLQKRLNDDPEYDPRTLHVPESFLAKQTPAMRQWWKLKSKHFDIVLFFKMGKFYELFHNDAVIAVKELGLIYMKGEYAHAGFPEIAFGRYADTLMQKGYKVARIEQMETPDMMSERCRKMGRACTKFDKVVAREVCSVQTAATRRPCFTDSYGDSDAAGATYLLALTEKANDASGCGSEYGVCFVDCTVGRFWLGQFTDDRHCSRLRTLLCHYPATQVLFERGRLSDKTQGVISNSPSVILRDALRPGAEFWTSSKTLSELCSATYFKPEGDTDTGGVDWPSALKKMLDEGDALGQTAAACYDLAVSALGGVTWYLQKCCLDEELLSLKRFDEYRPVDCPLERVDIDTDTGTAPKQEPTFPTAHQHMVLDAATMMNLELIQNGTTATLEGTLLGTLDLCVTPFGKRLFKQWLCAPLCHPVAIGDRLNAVEDLMQAPDVTSEMTDLFRKLPDLERLISRIHTLGSANRMKSHPDSRAIFFEEVTYSKRKIEDFLAALSGFRTAMTAVTQLQAAAPKFKSTLLRRTVTFEEGEGEGRFPDLTEMLKFFSTAFDHDKAKSAGVITPTKGVDPDYDTAIEDIKETRQELDAYLDKQKQRLGCRTLSYWGLGKNRFQIEVPDSAVKNVPRDYEVASQKKGFRRYRTATVDRLLATLVEAEDKRDVAIKDSMRRIFAAFDKNYTKWQTAVQCLSVLDALRSLAEYSKCAPGGDLCRPEFVMSCDQPLLEIRDGRHPCINHTFAGTDFIPNDTVIGTAEGPENDTSDDSQVVLVTGPNMGGKSTLMRQVGIIVVMAQLGCYVPASKCRLSPVDRVFTRLGASDRIMAGESTFFVELSETSAILQHATRHSLVLLDELGRGTATYDGTAIACAVVNELSTSVRCRTLFSTHYHSLVEEFSHDSNVRLGHMACMVENENSDDPSQETITFLYKFVSGACPKSYGFNAARLANIPDDIVKAAHMKAKQLELTTEQLKVFRTVFATEDISKISTLLETIEA